MPQTPIEDANLMARVAQGDANACRLLVQRHLNPLVGLAMRMTESKSEAEDIAQEAFVRLWKQSHDWQAKAKVSTWLYRVVHNLSIDAIRRKNRQTLSENDRVQISENTTSTQKTQDQMLHQQDITRQVETAISHLPERQRTAITLVHHRDMSNKDAAHVMDISVDALESLLARARRSLKEILSESRKDLLGAAS
ncbi:sigma-70 family RNA polymerase sigma factor [uncultured Kiloniella sp.]|uniref:sigma-70 family RNA polymerase sigma factor n=1 Tax=uncultured Kiloniella sp. TaxID=1133091 RepID=UPI0026379EFF|nr:sigma-70 family RNA polymerase sigma factor [uncultured Kiloniella sp.]